jgi:ribosomal 30S subunit maturation factor RimM
LVVGIAPGAVAPAAGSAVELRSSKRSYPQTIERIAGAGNDAIVAFSGARTINEALRFVGCSLWADVAEPEVQRQPGVLGFRVFDSRGEFWGTVCAQPQFSLNQVLEIEDDAGRTVYVPWHESLVVKVDRRARSLVIDAPAGLRDLNK